MSLNELSQGLAGMDPAEVALGAGLAGIVVTTMLFMNVAWFFISALGYYKMFQKTGEAGWKAFIPYYRTYICYKFAWDPKKFLVYFAASVIAQIVGSVGSIITNLIAIVAGIVVIVFGFKLDIRVAKSFGKSTIWGVALFFVPFVVSLILGFGKSEYIGNTTE